MIQAFFKGGFKSEGRGGFSQLPKMSAQKAILGFKKMKISAFTGLINWLIMLLEPICRSWKHIKPVKEKKS